MALSLGKSTGMRPKAGSCRRRLQENGRLGYPYRNPLGNPGLFKRHVAPITEQLHARGCGLGKRIGELGIDGARGGHAVGILSLDHEQDGCLVASIEGGDELANMSSTAGSNGVREQRPIILHQRHRLHFQQQALVDVGAKQEVEATPSPSVLRGHHIPIR